MLLPDVAAAPAAAPLVPDDASSPYQFTRQQLDVYGIYELQTLEDVLRRSGPHAGEARDAVARRIQRKIGWTEASRAVDSRAFLEAFYAALRGRLEARMLVGVRREDKHDRR